jgi:hypothetical protein
MPTAKQIFNAACNEALKDMRDVPVHKILNRLDIGEVLAMQRALAQQFVLLMRNAAEEVDPDRPGLKISERIARADQMRTITE